MLWLFIVGDSLPPPRATVSSKNHATESGGAIDRQRWREGKDIDVVVIAEMVMVSSLEVVTVAPRVAGAMEIDRSRIVRGFIMV